jgi:tetratricopeptide (TPR) repeat protein
MLVARAVTARRVAGDLSGARALVEEGLSAFPDHTDLVYELAVVTMQELRLDEAAAIAERAIEMGDAPAKYAGTVGSGSYLALCLLGEIAQKAGDNARAEEHYRTSLAEHPAFIAPVIRLAQLMLERGATPAEVAAEVPTDRPSAALLLATACYEAGHFEAGEQWFRSVLERQPANGAARIGLSEALLSQKRYADAAAEAALEPADSVLAAEAASAQLFAHAAAGDTASLRSTLTGAGAVVPPHEAEFYGAWGDQLEGNASAWPLTPTAALVALTVLEALLRVQEIKVFAALLPVYERISLPEGDRADALADIYFRRGFLESAADEWIAAHQRAPEARFLVSLAQVAIARGLPDDAIELAQGALALEPGHPVAQRVIEVLADRGRAAA